MQVHLPFLAENPDTFLTENPGKMTGSYFHMFWVFSLSLVLILKLHLDF